MNPELRSQSNYTDTSFEQVEIDGTEIVASEFHGCQFTGCSFVESVINRCRFIDCKFKGCDLSLVQVPASVFSATRFEDSKVIGVNWAQANWPAANLGEPLSFFKCVLSHSTFIGLKLVGIEMRQCVAHDVDFREAALARASFEGSDLAESLFFDTDLEGADLSQARNYQISPAANKLKAARFSLPEAMSLLYNLDIELVADN